MSVYDLVFRTADRLGVLEAVKPAARSALIAYRQTVGQDRRAIAAHFKTSEKPRLHIGAGAFRIDGWLNSDYTPKPGVVVVDATKKFPFRDSTFNYIYTEHMIEHISFSDGACMLQQCARVLKPGGTIRIVTPNFPVFLDFYRQPEDERYKAYMDWTWSELHRVGNGAEAPTSHPVFIINYYFKAWGHTFIYDEYSLRLSLEKAGFTNMRRENVNTSRHAELRNLEHLDRVPAGFYELESLVMEADKPA
ncbi:MAG TPA: methyltransferase domain-containing protein [Crenalkalicoccus sp.]|jgi:predicted SAM-dependent methyltransferase|nr:methyltransferase domain-containing protein [Crenalkalicoccus sp.]